MDAVISEVSAMTKSGELMPVANHPAASMNLICEVSENGCLVKWNAAWDDLVRADSLDRKILPLQAGVSSFLDCVNSLDVEKLATAFNSLRTGNQNVDTEFRVGVEQDCLIKMQWSCIADQDGRKSWLGLGCKARVEQDAPTPQVAASKRFQAVVEGAGTRSLDDAELAAFASLARHDLRAPLRALCGFSDILAEDYADVLDESGTDYLNRIVVAAERLGRTIDGVTEYLRLAQDSCCFQTVDLNQIVREVSELRSTDRCGVLGTVTAQSLPVVQGDPKQLWMLIRELIGNGFQHNTAEVPVVTVKWKALDREPGSALHSQRVAIWISDNGAGVSAKYREDIFAAFRKLMPTGETSGLGLGLAMAKRIVKRHGGHLRCEGTSDEKCAFVFDLQRAFERMS